MSKLSAPMYPPNVYAATVAGREESVWTIWKNDRSVHKVIDYHRSSLACQSMLYLDLSRPSRRLELQPTLLDILSSGTAPWGRRLITGSACSAKKAVGLEPFAQLPLDVARAIRNAFDAQ